MKKLLALGFVALSSMSVVLADDAAPQVGAQAERVAVAEPTEKEMQEVVALLAQAVEEVARQAAAEEAQQS